MIEITLDECGPTQLKTLQGTENSVSRGVSPSLRWYQHHPQIRPWPTKRTETTHRLKDL